MDTPNGLAAPCHKAWGQIDAPNLAENGSAMDILARAGISGLTAQSGIDEVEAALRRLHGEMAGADNIREMAMRSAATKHLQSVGIQAPAQLVGVALSRPERREGAHGIAFPEVEPWLQPVDGSLLLDGIAETLRRFVVLPPEETRAVALWIVHAYAIEATSICPILIVKSAEKRCGKTLLLELLFNLAFRPLSASNITASALFRAVERYKPVLLLDEADTFLCGNEELRGILNSGYRRSSSYVVRTVGEDFEPVVFDTFGPKAVALIGVPQETLLDRGVLIEMRRKTQGEQTERLRSDRVSEDFRHLRRKAARWATDNLERLTDRDPQVPQELNDRSQDSWRPLLAVAELAGARWMEYGRVCAAKLSARKSEVSKRTLLLADIREIFRRHPASRMASGDICARLAAVEEHPWPEWRDGRPITVRQLARMLEPLDIRPRQFRIADAIVRGYELDDFKDSFSRYLPDLPTDVSAS